MRNQSLSLVAVAFIIRSSCFYLQFIELIMAGNLKKTTFLKGLEVAKHPHHSLTNIYTRILRVLAKFPTTSAYRTSTEQIVKERAEIVKNTPDVETLEKKIGCGQVEELVVQAENELLLARKMAVWKPWEPLAEPIPKDQWTWPPHK
ncbi:NADH dehydrogenase [ubiquinone] 1 alpha subcomplex subunit 5 isoform X1 [Cotesia glomerata]|uniref:NADH dehydrogenase [ubiquinone] 1 alpha subcomplex subunit 5 isoform X1 n=2 Tax=Cotesia glomerata TaxID=32391 RepID=UPI001D01BCFE|nr:NADH dehydrogenase [ubiquinone] 1 alpha subcomplex subunit 5 isoform X1 [Cotesia glomerata]